MSLETITVTLSTIGTDAGPFIVKDEFINSYSGVSRSTLLAGYSNVFNNETTKFEITSSGVCTNNYQIDITRPNLYVYFSNDHGDTSGGRGALFWFSLNNYYSSNTPADVTTSNCVSTTEMGVTPNPSFTASISYWRNDVSNTLDAGGGTLRAADGTKTIYINDAVYPLTYNAVRGFWGRIDNIFTVPEGLYIAAIRIDSIGANSTVANNGVGKRYFYVIPNPTTFTRTQSGINSGFAVGSTGINFFNLT
jgi:hypothetical protein